jgi:hypothetical protein
MSNRVVIAGAVAYLVLLFLIWAVIGLWFLAVYIEISVVVAVFALPLWYIEHRRQKQMLREIEAAARGEERPRS